MKRLWVHKHAYTTGISCFKMPHFVSRVSFDNLFHQWRTITTRCAACSVTRKKKQTADNWNGVNWEAVECESKCKKSKKIYMCCNMIITVQTVRNAVKKARLVCKYQVRWYRWFVASSCFFPIVVECAERQYTTREEEKTQHWHPLLERYRITLQRRFSHGLGVCVTHLHFAVYFSFLKLFGSLTHFDSPLEQFDRLICNQLF